ncbi:MAG: hypothetical protein ACXABY_27500 [Candidatus Thorarchaeota archaeon]|jgi:hypothetical protein
MELSVLDRVLLFNVLPAEGNVTSLRIIRKLREDISFSDKENEEFGIKTEEGKITWNSNGTIKDIEIGEKATDIIVEALKDLDKRDKLTVSHLELYDKFIKDE